MRRYLYQRISLLCLNGYRLIEGKANSSASLRSIPATMLTNRQTLRLLHLGTHPNLEILPPVHNLPNLKVLQLAILYGVKQLSMNQLPVLTTFELVDMRRLATLPALEQFPMLRTVLLPYANAFCCNGFLSDMQCDTTTPMCQVNAAKYQATCRAADAPRSTAATLQLARSNAVNCYDSLHWLDIYDLVPSLALVDDACGGALYKQCQTQAYSGICYPLILMPVHCIPQTYIIAMRRAEIALGVGPKCNATNEAWLGCPASIAP